MDLSITRSQTLKTGFLTNWPTETLILETNSMGFNRRTRRMSQFMRFCTRHRCVSFYIMHVQLSSGSRSLKVCLSLHLWLCFGCASNHLRSVLKSHELAHTVKPALCGLSKEEQRLVFKTNYPLMFVKSNAECSKRAFCNTFDLH